jgi:hypothetical protein
MLGRVAGFRTRVVRAVGEPTGCAVALLVLVGVIGLAGCGSAGVAVEARPSHVDLGEIPFQGKTSRIPISLHNKTRSPVRIEYPRIDGDTPAQVAKAGTTCLTGKSMAAGGSCLVVVSLRADRFGVMKGELIVGYDQKGSPVTVPIVATGGGIPDLRVLTSRLDFGEQPVGGPPARAFISLRSRGTAAAWLDTFTIEGPGANSFRSDPAHSDCRSLDAIPPGMTCRLPITFSPSAAGSRTATAVLTTGTFVNGQPVKRSFRIELTGRGRHG